MEMKARVILDRTIVVSRDGRYEVNIRVLAIQKSEKFPMGIKAKFVLLDTHQETARLLVDNHEPYGFHMHTRLPNDPDHREKLPTSDHDEALEIFLREAERIARNEEK